MSHSRIIRTNVPTQNQARSVAWSAFEQLVNLAAEANIPICGGAFSLAREIVNIYNGLGSNQTASRRLLDSIASYAETIWEFVDAMDPSYLSKSEGYEAIVARTAIRTFGSNLEKVQATIGAHMRKGRLSRLLAKLCIEAEIAECEKELANSHRRFRDATSNVIVSSVRKLRKADALPDEFNIPGANVVPPGDVVVLRKVKTDLNGKTFWSDIFEAKISDNSTRLVKLYYHRSGGKEAFLKDVEWLGRNVSINIPRIYGHCQNASVPFIVFHNNSITPLSYHLLECATGMTPAMACGSAWKLVVDMNDAVTFLVENNMDVSQQGLDSLFYDAAVDERMNIILTRPEEPRDQWDKILTPEDVPVLLREAWVELCASASYRPYRSLQYALQGDHMKTFTPKHALLRDPALAYEGLRRLWPPGPSEGRWLFWPIEVSCSLQDPVVGDVGVFDVPKGESRGVFRKLCDLRKELGGVTARASFHLTPPWDRHLPEVSYDLGVISFKLHPSPACGAVPSPEDCDEASASHTGCWSVNEESHSHGMMKWHCNLPNATHTWDYFRRKAPAIARQQNVAPEDLVLVFDTGGEIRSGCPEVMAQSTHQPLYLYLHFEPSGRFSRAYWSFAEMPAIRDASLPALEGVRGLKAISDVYVPQYIQLETSDIIKDESDEVEFDFEPVDEETMKWTITEDAPWVHHPGSMY